MGFFSDLFGWKSNRAKAPPDTREITVGTLSDLAADYNTRLVAFNACVNLIANALAKCEIRTYRNYKEVKGGEWYTWNIAPNRNQNIVEFLHKLVYQLYSSNEALIIEAGGFHGDLKQLYVADDWMKSEEQIFRDNYYTNVVVGGVAFNRTFREDEVIHIKLNETNINPAVRAIVESYGKLRKAAEDSYNWESGVHLKCSVGQIAEGDENWADRLKDSMETKVKPWLKSRNGVLLQTDGVEYELMGSKSEARKTTRDVRALDDDIFSMTAKSMNIPDVLLSGNVAGTKDAQKLLLTIVADPLAKNMETAINMKRYSPEDVAEGTFCMVDTSTITHFDVFEDAANVERAVGSGTMSVNDILSRMRMPRINEPWAEKHYMTLNIGAMEQAVRRLNENNEEGEDGL